jgi:hypothetical protein
MPVVLQLTFVTGATKRARLPVEVWFQGDHYTFTTPLTAELVKVELDPDSALPDVRRDNNTWTKPTP